MKHLAPTALLGQRFARIAACCLLTCSLQTQAGIKDVSQEELAQLIANATGTAPTLKLNSAVQGSTVIFARLTRTGQAAPNGIGLCYSSTNPEPTVLDNYTLTTYSNNGFIYAMENLKPATVYYIRAFGIGANWKVGYSKPIKLYTLPKGNVSYWYENNGDDATNKRIIAAADDAIKYWNNVTGHTKNFSLSIHYVYGAGAGGGAGTADCSHGGYMRVGGNPSYQRTGTIMHEGSHGLGVIGWDNGYSPTNWIGSIYRSNNTRGTWLGDRVDRVMHFLENNNTAVLSGDYQHMWPYGINGAGEDNGTPILYYANALIVGALGEDNLPLWGYDFAKPAYTFEQDDTLKYYIKNADEDHGLRTSYLRENASRALRWQAGLSDDILANDSFAWHITFDPASCYYTFKNVATGNTIIYNGTTFRTAVSPSSDQKRLQLLAARETSKVGTYNFATKSYWITEPNGSKAMNAGDNEATNAADFDHANTATTQRWFLMTPTEVDRFGSRVGNKAVGIQPIQHHTDAQGALMVGGGHGFVAITATSDNADVQIVSLGGQLVKTVYVTRGNTATIQLPRGIYIVGGHKVAVK